MINKGLMTSKTNEWATPQDLFNELSEIYGPFDLDPCATKENAKCPKFFTKEDNGLSKDWFGKVFMNPPYGREIGKWTAKAKNEVESGNAELIVCLLPSRTDTKWWHRDIMPFFPQGIRFIKGRIRFDDGKQSAPFPSVIVVMN